MPDLLRWLRSSPPEQESEYTVTIQYQYRFYTHIWNWWVELNGENVRTGTASSRNAAKRAARQAVTQHRKARALGLRPGQVEKYRL